MFVTLGRFLTYFSFRKEVNKMGKWLTAVKRIIGRTFWRNTFNRDIVMQLIVSILLASLIAGTISVAADTFFGKTLTSLVGDYGEKKGKSKYKRLLSKLIPVLKCKQDRQ